MMTLPINPEQERALRDIAQATRKTAARLDPDMEQMCVDSMIMCSYPANPTLADGCIEWTTNDSRYSFTINPDGFWTRHENDLS